MLFEVPKETERLLLRAETLADCDAIYALNTDPAVMQWIGNGSVMTLSRGQLEMRLREWLDKRANDTYGLAAVILKETGRYIGACWLKHDDFCGGVELGYRYCKDSWGRGYATEAGRAVLKAGFDLPQLKEVYARAHPENTASLKVIEKLGFERIDDRYDSLAKTHTPVCRLTRQEYFSLFS